MSREIADQWEELMEDEIADRQSLKDADRQLTAFIDVAIEERGDAPAWLLAAREAVREVKHGDD